MIVVKILVVVLALTALYRGFIAWQYNSAKKNAEGD